jgi:hypothetical protein
MVCILAVLKVSRSLLVATRCAMLSLAGAIGYNLKGSETSGFVISVSLLVWRRSAP